MYFFRLVLVGFLLSASTVAKCVDTHQRPEPVELFTYSKPECSLRDLGAIVPEEFHDIARVIKKDGHHPAILLYGPPGTGKSMMAEGLANELVALGWKYIRATGTLVSSKYQEGSTVDFKEFIEKIEQSGMPTVLALNECGPLFNKLNGASGDSRESLLNEMKSFLEECNENKKRVPILVIATTNDYEKIDEAIQSRFNNDAYEISAVSDVEREKVIGRLMVKVTGDDSDCAARAQLIKKLNAHSKKLSIRDIKGFMEKARRFTIGAGSSSVEDCHFYHALSVAVYAKMKHEKDAQLMSKTVKSAAKEIVVRIMAELVMWYFFKGAQNPAGEAVKDVAVEVGKEVVKEAATAGSKITGHMVAGAAASAVGWHFRERIGTFFGHFRRHVHPNEGERVEQLELEACQEAFQKTRKVSLEQKNQRQNAIAREEKLSARRNMVRKTNRLLSQILIDKRGIKKVDLLIVLKDHLDEIRSTIGDDLYVLILKRIDDYYTV